MQTVCTWLVYVCVCTCACVCMCVHVCSVHVKFRNKVQSINIHINNHIKCTDLCQLSSVFFFSLFFFLSGGDGGSLEVLLSGCGH